MFISDAYAAPAAGAQDSIMGLLPFVIIFVLFYFMLIRPQMKRAKEQKKMIESLQKGDEAITVVIGQRVKQTQQQTDSNKNVLP